MNQRRVSPSAQRYSIATFWPSTKPIFFKPTRMTHAIFLGIRW
jgi:hypothetical protein